MISKPMQFLEVLQIFRNQNVRSKEGINANNCAPEFLTSEITVEKWPLILACQSKYVSKTIQILIIT